MSLSSTRQEFLLRGQHAIARKVFELVPIQDAWDSKQIQSALQRTTRCSMDFRTLQGCLRALRESGLISERNGLYQRTTLRKAMPATTHMNGTEPAQQPTSALELLSELSDRARQLAQDIDAAAAVIAEEAAQNEESLRKLVQLQSILKSLA